MSTAGRICVRPLADLVEENSNISESRNLLMQQATAASNESSPLKSADGKKARRRAATTGKKAREQVDETAESPVKKSRTTKKVFKKDERQKTIDCFFKSGSKNFQIPSIEARSFTQNSTKKSRRRIVYNDKSDTTTVSNESKYQEKSMIKTNKQPVVSDFVDLCATDSEGEEPERNKNESSAAPVETVKTSTRKRTNSSRKQTKNGDTLQSENSDAEEIRKSTRKNKSGSHIKSPFKSTSAKKSKKNIPQSMQNSSSEQNGNAMNKNEKPELKLSIVANKSQEKQLLQENDDNCPETESLDELIPASLEDGRRKQRVSLSLSLKNVKRHATNQGRLSSSSTLTPETKTPANCEALAIENSPPTSSILRTNVTNCKTLMIKNDKENCVPVSTKPRSSRSRDKQSLTVHSAAIAETTLVSTEIQVEETVEISDDDFEYVQTKTMSIKTKTKNSRKTRSNQAKNNEPLEKKPKKSRPLPHYKIIEGTNGTIAVDAFCYGSIPGVSHYFLTHFHADHYIGLTRKFAHNLYMSSITARLLRAFIPIEEQYIKEMQLNVPIMIDDIEVTAIDANHCPGAVMLIFKLPDGRCMLHTGDFRASSDMESEPIFWNCDIHTIYLDTTYIHQKHAFMHQSESIDRAKRLMQEFIEKNVGTRTLFVCGSYLVGKEKFWSTLARDFNLKVFAEGNRKKSLLALEDENLKELLTENPTDANMHVISIQKLSYHLLVEYHAQYADNFDLIFALRPSGWEMNSKPQYRGKINIIGVEYSEHSSRDEMQRFVQYLKPQNVISTVPVGRDATITAKIPNQWYKYTTLKRQCQPSITSYFKTKPDQYFKRLTKKYTSVLADNPISPNATEAEVEMQNEPPMLISPDTANVEVSRSSIRKEATPKAKESFEKETLVTNLKPKKERLATVPFVKEPIVIDCDTDDDWLT